MDWPVISRFPLPILIVLCVAGEISSPPVQAARSLIHLSAGRQKMFEVLEYVWRDSVSLLLPTQESHFQRRLTGPVSFLPPQSGHFSSIWR